MEKARAFTGIARASRVLLKIAEVAIAIAVVFMLMGMVALAALPDSLLAVNVDSDVSVRINMADWIGKETWMEIRDTVKDSIRAENNAEKVEVDEKGLSVTANTQNDFNRANLALSIAPAVLQLAAAWFFCRTLGKFCKTTGQGGEPFTGENASLLRTSGITLLVIAAAPWLVSTAVGLFIRLYDNTGIRLVPAFAGLLMLGLASLFEATADRLAASGATQPPAPPFGGYAGFDRTAPQQTPAEPAKREDPEKDETKQANGKSPFDPDAF